MEVREPSAKYLARPAYKQTEVGLIPEDWEVLTIGELASTSSGTTPARAQADRYFTNGTIPWVKTLDLNDAVISETAEAVTPSALAETCLQLYPPGCVLVAMYGGYNQIGRTGLLHISATVNQALTAIRPDTKRLHAGYLLRVLNFRVDYWRSVASSSRKDPNITSRDVREFPLAIPPVVEQQAIAGALCDVDALIEALEQLLAKKRQIKQGAMQDLLTGQKRLPGFAGEWEVKRLGDLLIIRHGKSQRGVEVIDGAYPILATGGQIGQTNQSLYDKPSVLIGRKGTIDQPRYMDTPFWTVDTLFYSEVYEPNSASFLFYRFCLIDWKQYNEASGVPSLNARTIEAVEILCPATEEQIAIATVLSDMDSELAALEAKLAKARDLKQGMMQELLTGRIRLV